MRRDPHDRVRRRRGTPTAACRRSRCGRGRSTSTWCTVGNTKSLPGRPEAWRLRECARERGSVGRGRVARRRGSTRCGARAAGRPRAPTAGAIRARRGCSSRVRLEVEEVDARVPGGREAVEHGVGERHHVAVPTRGRRATIAAASTVSRSRCVDRGAERRDRGGGRVVVAARHRARRVRPRARRSRRPRSSARRTASRRSGGTWRSNARRASSSSGACRMKELAGVALRLRDDARREIEERARRRARRCRGARTRAWMSSGSMSSRTRSGRA